MIYQNQKKTKQTKIRSSWSISHVCVFSSFYFKCNFKLNLNRVVSLLLKHFKHISFFFTWTLLTCDWSFQPLAASKVRVSSIRFWNQKRSHHSLRTKNGLGLNTRFKTFLLSQPKLVTSCCTFFAYSSVVENRFIKTRKPRTRCEMTDENEFFLFE